MKNSKDKCPHCQEDMYSILWRITTYKCGTVYESGSLFIKGSACYNNKNYKGAVRK